MIYSTSNGNVIKAIKHVPDLSGEFRHRGACKLLKNEYEIVSKFNHPNIIKYLEYEQKVNI